MQDLLVENYHVNLPNKFKKKMLKIILLVFVVGSLNIYAQDASYTGAAKMEVKAFWRQAEMFKKGKATSSTISNMEKALVNVKQKDPIV